MKVPISSLEPLIFLEEPIDVDAYFPPTPPPMEDTDVRAQGLSRATSADLVCEEERGSSAEAPSVRAGPFEDLSGSRGDLAVGVFAVCASVLT